MSSNGSHDEQSIAGASAVIDGTAPRPPVSVVVAHPGHELLAYGWLMETRPSVFVVTDGSGRDAGPRIEASAGLLEPGLGSRASVFGRWTDRELYDALSECRFEPFLALRDELVSEWIAGGVRSVICDAYERRVLMHDVVQLTVASAVEAAGSRGFDVALFELPIYLASAEERPVRSGLAVTLTMSDGQLAKKLEAARTYDSVVVRREVEAFLEERGPEAFRSEVLFLAVRRTPRDLEREPKPQWETHGERLMQDGVYDRVIRLQDHVVPLARTLESALRHGGRGAAKRL